MTKRMGFGLGAAFGLLLAVTTSLALAGCWGTEAVAGLAREVVTVESRVIELAQRARANTLGLRRYEKDILLSIGSPDQVDWYVGEWEEQLERLRRRLDGLDQKVVTEEDRRVIEGMRRGTANYEAGFRSVIAGIRSGSLRTPQEGNLALESYKEIIRGVQRSAYRLAMRHSRTLEIRERVVDAQVGRTRKAVTSMLALAAILTVALGIVSARIGVPSGRGRTAPSVARSVPSAEGDHTRNEVAAVTVAGASLRGQTIDAARGTALQGVEVSLWPAGVRDTTPAAFDKTDTSGRFEVRALHPGRYRILTSKPGYGQEVRELDLRGPSSLEVSIELTAAPGLSLEVVDARDDRTVEAFVVVRDLAWRIVANVNVTVDAGGRIVVPLADGHYLLSVAAAGYGTVTLPVFAPGSGLHVGLTPGGTLLVDCERDLRGRIRLVQPDGDEYLRCWRNGIADVRVTGRRTKVPNVTPGTYRVEIVGDAGAFSGGQMVAIREGQVSVATIA